MNESVLILRGEYACKITNPEILLKEYRSEYGADYYDYQPVTNPATLVPEDLAVTLAVNSNASWRAFRSMKEHAHEVNLAVLPDKTLADTDSSERDSIAELIMHLVAWPGFGSSLATKVLHKKRPALIPVLDNQSIFGAYANPAWPEQAGSWGSVSDLSLIRAVLENLYLDVVNLHNQRVWGELKRLEPAFSRIEILDCVWWMHFRSLQPTTT